MKQLEDHDLLLYFTKFKREIKPRDHSYLFTTYKECFSGKEAIKVLTSLFNVDQTDAIELGNQMVGKKLFIHVTHKTSTLKDKRYEFYRFTNFRRCSKRMSILDVSQFTSGLDASYQKLIQEEYKSGRIGDIRILLDDVYNQHHDEESSPLTSPKSANSDTSPQPSVFKKNALPPIKKNSIFGSSPSQTSCGSPPMSSSPLPSPPISMPSSSSTLIASTSSLLSDSSCVNSLRKSPRGAESLLWTVSSGMSSGQVSKAASEEDLFVKRSVRLHEYHDPSTLGLVSPRFLKNDNYLTNSGYTGLFDFTNEASTPQSTIRASLIPNNASSSMEAAIYGTSPNSSNFVKRKTIRSSSLGGQEFIDDLELKRSLEDTDVDLNRFPTIDDVLKHPKATAMLTQFAVEEYAEEGIMFFKDVKSYRKESRLSKKLDMAIKIYDVYINPEGQLALNINKKLIDECRKKHLTGDDDCFDDIGKEVKRSLTDLFERMKVAMAQQKANHLNMLNSKNCPSHTTVKSEDSTLVQY